MNSKGSVVYENFCVEIPRAKAAFLNSKKRFLNNTEFVKENIGPSTPINYEVKKNILGGIILKYKDNEIDLSINNKYNELKIMLAT